MPTSSFPATIALQVFIRHIREWSQYYEQGRRTAVATLEAQSLMLDELADDDPNRAPLERMYMRTLTSVEVYEYIAGEIADIAQIAFAKVVGKGKIRSQAAARRRLRMVINLLSEGLLRFAYDQVEARKMYARAARNEDLLDLDDDTRRRLEEAGRAEFSQRLIALEHVVNSVGPIVVAFSEQFPCE